MKQSLFTLLVFCAFLPQVFMGQDVKVVVGNTVEYGQRQPILAPGTGAPATPLTAFSVPVPTAGISNQGKAGVSSYVESPEGVVTATYPVTPVYQNAEALSVPEAAAAVQNPQEEMQGEVGLVIAPSFGGAQSPQKSISLGEGAASYKAIGRSKNIRIFSNTD